MLNRIDWDKIFGTITCPNQLIDRFLQTLNEVLDIMAPVKKLSKKEASLRIKPWITKGIITSIKVRDKLYHRYLAAKSPINKSLLLDKYIQYRNLIVTLTRLSKKNHYKLFFDQNKTNIKQTWDGIKELVNLNKKQNSTPHKLILKRNKVVQDTKSIAKAFNAYFSSVGKSLDEKIPISNKSFTDFLTEPTSCSMYLRPTTHSEVSDLIKALGSFRACGPNSFPTSRLN